LIFLSPTSVVSREVFGWTFPLSGPDFVVISDGAEMVGQLYLFTERVSGRGLRVYFEITDIEGVLAKEQEERSVAMNRQNNHDGRIARMTFASVYPHYLAKVEKKGRTKEELHRVISWLTGFSEATLQTHIEGKVTFEQFFQQAKLNPNAHLITGVICGYRVEEIQNPLTQQARYLDKLVDELAKGRKMEKILRAG
jgi:hypothetical protein